MLILKNRILFVFGRLISPVAWIPDVVPIFGQF